MTRNTPFCHRCRTLGHRKKGCPQRPASKQPALQQSMLSQKDGSDLQGRGTTQAAPQESSTRSSSSDLDGLHFAADEPQQGTDGDSTPRIDDLGFAAPPRGESIAVSDADIHDNSSQQEDRELSDVSEITRHLRLFTGSADQGRATGAGQMHTLATMPIFSSRVKAHLTATKDFKRAGLFSKYGLLGLRRCTYKGDDSNGQVDDPADNLI
jgi:hypothetical protein